MTRSNKPVRVQLYEKAEEKILNKTSEDLLARTRQRAAANLVKESFLPAGTFRKYGVGEHASDMIIPVVLKPNIWIQDEAIERRKIDLFNFDTVKEVADVVTEHVLRNYSKTIDAFKRIIGRRDYDVYLNQGVYDAKLIEMLYVDLAGNAPVVEEAEIVGWAGIAKLVSRNCSKLRKLFEINGVDVFGNDFLGIYQVIKHYGFDNFVRDVCRYNPYFNRRKEFIEKLKSENITKDIAGKSQNMGNITDEKIIDWLIDILNKNGKYEIIKVLKDDSSGNNPAIIKLEKQPKSNDKARKRLVSLVTTFADAMDIPYKSAWIEFGREYYREYGEKLSVLKARYKVKHGLETLSTPEYLERTGRLEQGLKVAEKMLARVPV